MGEVRVRHGGLMRCCIATLTENADNEYAREPREGDTATCRYCHEPSGMIFRDGAWEWARP